MPQCQVFYLQYPTETIGERSECTKGTKKNKSETLSASADKQAGTMPPAWHGTSPPLQIDRARGEAFSHLNGLNTIKFLNKFEKYSKI